MTAPLGAPARPAALVAEKERVMATSKVVVPTKMDALMRVFELASELTNAVDMAAEDIGGHRPIKAILQELGPACDVAETAIRIRSRKP